MKNNRLLFFSFLALTICFSETYRLCRELNNSMIIRPEGMDIAKQQSSGYGDYSSNRAYQKITRFNGIIKARYGFSNFNGNRLNISFAMDKKNYIRYLNLYGYTDAEINALRSKREETRRKVWTAAYQIGGKPAAERALVLVNEEYKENLRKFLHSKGFSLKNGKLVQADIPLIVKRNKKMMRSLAKAFQKIANQRGYDSYDTIGSVLAMAQTAIKYKVPPMMIGKFHTGGIYPPAKTLLKGQGDCDTKTALVASILSNWSGIKMIGISIPGHYLMAVRRIPGKGDRFVRYGGIEYVLTEPAGPAWLEPGRVGDHTADLISNGNGFKIEPFS